MKWTENKNASVNSWQNLVLRWRTLVDINRLKTTHFNSSIQIFSVGRFHFVEHSQKVFVGLVSLQILLIFFYDVLTGAKKLVVVTHRYKNITLLTKWLDF